MVVYLEVPTKDVDSVHLHVLHHRPSIPYYLRLIFQQTVLVLIDMFSLNNFILYDLNVRARLGTERNIYKFRGHLVGGPCLSVYKFY